MLGAFYTDISIIVRVIFSFYQCAQLILVRGYGRLIFTRLNLLVGNSSTKRLFVNIIQIKGCKLMLCKHVLYNMSIMTDATVDVLDFFVNVQCF